MKNGNLLRLMMVVAFVAAIVAPVTAAGSEFDQIAAAADAWANSGKAMIITADKLFENMNDGDKANDPVVIDIRAAKDYDAGHIPGAMNIAFADLFKAENLAKIAKDKQAVLSCYTGHTCSMASFALNSMGYNTLSLKWAIMGWTKDPLVSTQRFGDANNPQRDYKLETTENKLSGTNALPAVATGKTAVADMIAARAVEFLGSGKASTVTADKLFENLNDGDKANDPIIIDTRKAEEYALGHIPGAVNLPLGQLFKAATLPTLSKDKQIVVVCYTGHTGSMASFMLDVLGYNSQALKWGMMGWTKDAKVSPTRFGTGNDPERDYKIEKTAAAATTATAPAATTATALPKTGAVPDLPSAALMVSGLAALAAGLGLRRRSR